MRKQASHVVLDSIGIIQAAPSRIHWVTPFLDAKFNALVVTQGYYLEDAPVAYLWGKTGCGNREVDNRTPRSSFQRKIPALIQYNQVIPGDHLSDQDSPPVQTGFSPLGRLTIEVARNKGPPTSLFEAFLKEDDLGLEDLERIVWGEVAAVHTNPRHFHPNEPRVGLQEIPDAQIRATDKDPSPPWCILVPSRVFGQIRLNNYRYGLSRAAWALEWRNWAGKTIYHLYDFFLFRIHTSDQSRRLKNALKNVSTWN